MVFMRPTESAEQRLLRAPGLAQINDGGGADSQAVARDVRVPLFDRTGKECTTTLSTHVLPLPGVSCAFSP